jgi:hypothetical protein
LPAIRLAPSSGSNGEADSARRNTQRRFEKPSRQGHQAPGFAPAWPHPVGTRINPV